MATKLDIAKFQVRALRRTRSRVVGALQAMCAGCIADTPVLTGALKANWRFAADAPDTTVVSTTVDPTAKVEADIDAQYTVQDRRYFFTNPLPYATAIEFGHSQKAPYGMLRVNMARFKQLLRRRIK